MRIPSGSTDKKLFFVSVSTADVPARLTGFGASGWTVYRSRNAAAAAAYTTPTITELSSGNMPGVYALTIDEDSTITSGDDAEEYCVHISRTTGGARDVTRVFELYRPETTEGRTLSLSTGSAAAADWGNVDRSTSTQTFANTTIGTVTTNTDVRGTDSALLAANVPTNFASTAITTGGAVSIDWGSVVGSTSTVALANTTVGIVTTVGTVTTLTGHTAQTGDSFARIGAQGVGLGDLGGMSTAMKAEVQTEANDALVANGLDHLLAASVAGADVVDDSVIAQLTSKSTTADWDTFDNATDSLEAISDGGGAGPSAATIADAVWDEAQADHVAAGNFGVTASEIASILDDTGTAGVVVDWSSIANTTATIALTNTTVGLTTGAASLAQTKQIWDRVLTGATHNIATSAGRRLRGIQEFQGYDLGAIWIDTVNGSTGTTDFENGTVENPTSSMANANTLAASLGLSRFRVAPGSSITLAASQVNQEFEGRNWTLALGGQSVSGSFFEGADVTGIATSTGEVSFLMCHIGAVTLPPSHINACGLEGTLTAGSAGTFFLDDCHSGVAGTSTPVFDFGAALNASNANFRRYSGGVEIQNMGAGTGSYNMSLEGHGQLVINANCSATATVALRGHFNVTDNSGGAVTLSEAANVPDNFNSLGITTGGNVSMNWAAISGSTTTVALTNTTVGTATTLTNVPSNFTSLSITTGGKVNVSVLETTASQAIADEVLIRDVTNTQATAGTHSLTASVLGVLESSVSTGGTWTIKTTTGGTFTTKTVTLSTSAKTITAVT